MEPLSAAWEDYRRRVAVAVFVPAIGMVTSGMVGVAVDWLGGPDGVFFILAGITLAVSLFAWIRLATFPCPKCGSWFATTLMHANPLTTRCLHCGHGKWEFVHARQPSGVRSGADA